MSFGFGGNQFSSISNFNDIDSIRGPQGPQGVSLDDVTVSQATGSDNVSLNFILSSGETKSVSFSAVVDNVITGGTFDTMYINNLYSTNSNLSAGPVTVTNINGTNFSNLASDFVTLQYSYSSTVNQSVQTGADVSFGDVTCENVYASVITADIVNSSVFNAITTNEFLVSDKYILGCAAPTGPTGSWNLDGPTGSNDGAIMGFASGYNEAVGFRYVYASNRFDLLADRLDIGYLKLIKTEPSTAVQYLTLIGKDDPVISGKMYIGNGSGKCFYFANHNGSTSTNLICLDDLGTWTTKGKIGIDPSTTEWDPTRLLEIRHSTEANIGLVANSGTHDADILLNDSSASLDLRTSTATAIRFRPNTNSNSNYVHIGTTGRLGINCVADSAYFIDSLGNQRINSTSGDSSLTIMNTVSASNNYTSFIQKSGTTNKYLLFKNYSNSPNSGDLLYAFENYSAVQNFQIRNNYCAVVGNKLAISDSSVGNFSPTGNVHIKASSSSFYLESTSGNSGVVFQGPSSSGSSAQFYLDTSNNYFVSNFHLNKPIVFQVNNGSTINAMRIEGDSYGSILFSQNSRPAISGYTPPNGSVYPNGDLRLGSSANVYRNVILGSGNSYSALFTRYANIGDAIALSHNWFYDNNGSQIIPNSGLECNALTVGTKFRFYTSTSTGATPQVNFNIYGKRLTINRGDTIGDGHIDIQNDGSADSFVIRDSSANKRYVINSSNQFVIRNNSGTLLQLSEFSGASTEYYSNFYVGYQRFYCAGDTIGVTAARLQIPGDTSESIQTTLKAHFGAMTNVTSGYQHEITGNSKINGNLQISGTITTGSDSFISQANLVPDVGLGSCYGYFQFNGTNISLGSGARYYTLFGQTTLPEAGGNTTVTLPRVASSVDTMVVLLNDHPFTFYLVSFTTSSFTYDCTAGAAGRKGHWCVHMLSNG